MRRAILALAGFTLLTLAVFRPTPSELAHTSPASYGSAGDAMLLMYAISRVSRQLLHDPWHLFDGGFYWPARWSLAYSDHMIGQALLGLPVWLLTRNPLLEYNLLALASYALGATAAFVYVRATVGSTAAAAAAGIVFSFTPYRFSSPLWLQVLCHGFVPLALLAWLRFVREGRWRDWTAWVGCWAAHSLLGLYLALYFAVLMGLLGALALALAPCANRRRLWVGTLTAPLVLGLLVAPTLWPYLALRESQGHVRTFGFTAGPEFLLPGPGTLSGMLAGLQPAPPGQYGPGLLVVALVVIGLLVGRRSDAPWARFVWRANAAGLAATLALLFVPLEWQVALPGFDMMRATNRAWLVGLVFVAWLAGRGVAWVIARPASARARTAAAVAIVALLALDMGTPPLERKRLPLEAELGPVYEAVRAMPEAVLYEAANGFEPNVSAMWAAIFHEKSIVNGYSGFISPGPGFALHRLAELPEPAARHLLDALDVRMVLVRGLNPGHLDTRLRAFTEAGFEPIARDGRVALLRARTRGGAPALAPAVAPLPPPVATVATAGAEDVALLFDPEVDTAWRVQVTSGTPPPTLTLDLGAVRPVAGVRAVAGRDTPRGLYSASLETSEDGVAWTPSSARFEPESLERLYEAPTEMRTWEARLPTRAARFVRLANPPLGFWGGVWEIADLRILGDCARVGLPGCPDGAGARAGD